MADNEDQGSLPKPSNETEWILSKLYTAMMSTSSSLRAIDLKTDPLSQKIDALTQTAQDIKGSLLLVAERLDRLIDFERSEHVDLNALRTVLAELHQRSISTGHEVMETRKKLEETTGRHILASADDEDGAGARGVLITWATAWRAARWLWKAAKWASPILLPAGGAVMYHAARMWLSGG